MSAGRDIARAFERAEAALAASEEFQRRRGAFERALGEIHQIRRGQVWCLCCGATVHLDGVRALVGDGWPKCCGQTMSISSPEEVAASRQGSAP